MDSHSPLFDFGAIAPAYELVRAFEAADPPKKNAVNIRKPMLFVNIIRMIETAYSRRHIPMAPDFRHLSPMRAIAIPMNVIPAKLIDPNSPT